MSTIADKIEDALCYIDDELIEAVDCLRKADAEKKRSFRWHGVNVKLVFAAAVICILTVTAFTAGPALIIFEGDFYKSKNFDANMEEIGDYTHYTEATMGASEALGGTVTGQTILVEILEVYNNGFVAKVVNDYGNMNIYGNEVMSEGEKAAIYIVYSDNVEFAEDAVPKADSTVLVEYSIKEGKIMADRIIFENGGK